MDEKWRNNRSNVHKWWRLEHFYHGGAKYYNVLCKHENNQKVEILLLFQTLNQWKESDD